MIEVKYMATLDRTEVNFIDNFHTCSKAYSFYLKTLFNDGKEIIVQLHSNLVSNDHDLSGYTRYFTIQIGSHNILIPRLKHSMAIAIGEGRCDHKASLEFKAVYPNFKDVNIKELLLLSIRNNSLT